MYSFNIFLKKPFFLIFFRGFQTPINIFLPQIAIKTDSFAGMHQFAHSKICSASEKCGEKIRKNDFFKKKLKLYIGKY